MKLKKLMTNYYRYNGWLDPYFIAFGVLIVGLLGLKLDLLNDLGIWVVGIVVFLIYIISIMDCNGLRINAKEITVFNPLRFWKPTKCYPRENIESINLKISKVPFWGIPYMRIHLNRSWRRKRTIRLRFMSSKKYWELEAFLKSHWKGLI